MKTETKRYIEAIGRRKTSIARVRIIPADKNSIVVNDKDVVSYFPLKEQQVTIHDALNKAKQEQKFSVSVLVNGGGMMSQADAVRHGISRALIKFKPELRIAVKRLGFLKRDPRAKERRKPGLKKARKAPRWSKR